LNIAARVTAFHEQRRMFVILNDNIIVAPEKVDYSHQEWFTRLFGSVQADIVIDAWVRGFVLQPHIYCYIGKNYSWQKSYGATCQERIREIIRMFNLNRHGIVYGGMIPGPEGELWVPATAVDYCDRYLEKKYNPNEEQDDLNVSFAKKMRKLVDDQRIAARQQDQLRITVEKTKKQEEEEFLKVRKLQDILNTVEGMAKEGKESYCVADHAQWFPDLVPMLKNEGLRVTLRTWIENEDKADEKKMCRIDINW